MDQQSRKGLTIIQLLSLIAVLGIALTIAARLWSGPSGENQSNAERENRYNVAESP